MSYGWHAGRTRLGPWTIAVAVIVGGAPLAVAQGTSTASPPQAPAETAGVLGGAGAPTPSDREDPALPPSVIRSTSLHYVDARAAALLMSGQRGGNLEGALAIGPRSSGGEGEWIPFWVELRVTGAPLSGGAAEDAFDLFAYALDEQGDVDGYRASTAAVSGNAAKLHEAIAASAAATTLRVLVRRRTTGQLFLAEVRIPGPDTGDRQRAVAVFPDSSAGWERVFPPSSEPAYEVSQGIAIDGARRVPLGRPVVDAGARVRFFVVPWHGAANDARLVAKLRHARGMVVDAGGVSVTRTSDPQAGYSSLEVEWTVAETDPGEYALELSFSDASAGIVVPPVPVVVRQGENSDRAMNWVALPASPAADSGAVEAFPSLLAGTADDQLAAYTGALKHCAENRWKEGVGQVLALETSAVSPAAQRSLQPAAATPRPDDLLRIEVAAAVAIARRTPEAFAPLLKLHHDVFIEWRRRGDASGQAHALRLTATLAEAARRSGSRVAKEAASAVLSSLADAVSNLSAPSEAVALFRAALEADPGHVPSHVGLAVIAEWYGRYDDAAEMLREVVGDSEGAAEGRLRLGINLLRTGNPSDATAMLVSCTRTPSPAWIRALAFEELAVHLLDAGRTADAQRLLAEATAALPDDETLVLLLAYSYEAQGTPAGGRAVLGVLDRARAETYNETPRMRYARWSFEVFAQERRRAELLSQQHIDDLASALSPPGGERVTDGA